MEIRSESSYVSSFHISTYIYLSKQSLTNPSQFEFSQGYLSLAILCQMNYFSGINLSAAVPRI